MLAKWQGAPNHPDGIGRSRLEKKRYNKTYCLLNPRDRKPMSIGKRKIEKCVVKRVPSVNWRNALQKQREKLKETNASRHWKKYQLPKFIHFSDKLSLRKHKKYKKVMNQLMNGTRGLQQIAWCPGSRRRNSKPTTHVIRSTKNWKMWYKTRSIGDMAEPPKAATWQFEGRTRCAPLRKQMSTTHSQQFPNCSRRRHTNPTEQNDQFKSFSRIARHLAKCPGSPRWNFKLSLGEMESTSKIIVCWTRATSHWCNLVNKTLENVA